MMVRGIRAWCGVSGCRAATLIPAPPQNRKRLGEDE